MTNDLKFTTAGDYMKMNKLIEELAAKANFGHMENNEIVYDPRLKKFAEMIVQECMSNLYLNGYDDAMIQIKKHFEVEQ